MKGWSGGVDRAAALTEGRIGESAFPAVAQATRGQVEPDELLFEFLIGETIYSTPFVCHCVQRVIAIPPPSADR
jgi:hypothetical protein